jgi:hypothetical protein
MANMSYCQLHNTNLAVRQLAQSIEAGDPIGAEERAAARALIETLDDLFMALCSIGYDCSDNLEALDAHFKRLDHSLPAEEDDPI